MCLGGEIAILNLNCRVLDFVNCVKRRCECAQQDRIDLVDEQYQFKNLDKQQPGESISGLLEARSTYIPVVFEMESSRASTDAASPTIPFRCLLNDEAFQKRLSDEYLAAQSLRDQLQSRKFSKSSRRGNGPLDAPERSEVRRKWWVPLEFASLSNKAWSVWLLFHLLPIWREIYSLLPAGETNTTYYLSFGALLGDLEIEESATKVTWFHAAGCACCTSSVFIEIVCLSAMELFASVSCNRLQAVKCILPFCLANQCCFHCRLLELLGSDSTVVLHLQTSGGPESCGSAYVCDARTGLESFQDLFNSALLSLFVHLLIYKTCGQVPHLNSAFLPASCVERSRKCFCTCARRVGVPVKQCPLRFPLDVEHTVVSVILPKPRGSLHTHWTCLGECMHLLRQ